MNIKSIKTNYVAEAPAAASLINPEYLEKFVPYYECKIVSDKGVHYGTGESEFSAEESAMENLKRSLAAEANTALAQYDARHSAGNLDIA